MIRGLSLCTAYRAAAAWIVAAPTALALGAPLAHHPLGDGALFEPGGTWLLEAGRLALPGARAVFFATSGAALVLTLGSLLPAAVLMAEASGRRGRGALGAAASRIGTLTLLWAMAFVAKLTLAGASLLQVARFGLLTAVSEPPWITVTIAGALFFLITVAQDAASLARFGHAEDVWQAITQAASVLTSPRLWWGAAWRAAVGAASLLGATIAVFFVAPSSAGAALLVSLVGTLGFFAARASWWSRLSQALGEL